MDENIQAIRDMDLDQLSRAVYLTIPSELCPSPDFMDSITVQQQTDVLRSSLLVYELTNQTIVPREFQHRAAFGPLGGKDSFVVAGTGSGKSLVVALPCILRPAMMSLVLCPTKRLQATQVRIILIYPLEFEKYSVYEGRGIR
ncbi:hypothetical protein PLICRDRAFT_107055 [Plicaturopsis crispa FD-325 SS-3]|nr:hypothetical protein PLICRDRAFT_107055 [Plicaturopsis crispa FD-325 SS-3]